MQLLNKISVSDSPSAMYTLETPFGDGFIKILGKGELAAKGRDHHLLIRLNGNDSFGSYRSYVYMGGDYVAGERDNTGLYLGRNGKNSDSTFMFDYTLAIDSNTQKIAGNGLSTFSVSHPEVRILGYQSHGYFVSEPQITSIEVVFTGGVVNGNFEFYSLEGN
ncbi:hypothetical protein [Bacillus subtilis]|uniref:hypothetical protein n=1 Tax=Bacillus subtilis TaxID=1423 RepID=UPI0015E6FCE9|nr:hypothetical protein [Bacillus subtilis]